MACLHFVGFEMKMEKKLVMTPSTKYIHIKVKCNKGVEYRWRLLFRSLPSPNFRWDNIMGTKTVLMAIECVTFETENENVMTLWSQQYKFSLFFFAFEKQQSQTNGLNVELRWPFYGVLMKIESDQIERFLVYFKVRTLVFLVHFWSQKSALASNYKNSDFKCWRHGLRSQKRTMARISHWIKGQKQQLNSLEFVKVVIFFVSRVMNTVLFLFNSTKCCNCYRKASPITWVSECVQKNIICVSCVG